METWVAVDTHINYINLGADVVLHITNKVPFQDLEGLIPNPINFSNFNSLRRSVALYLISLGKLPPYFKDIIMRPFIGLSIGDINRAERVLYRYVQKKWYSDVVLYPKEPS